MAHFDAADHNFVPGKACVICGILVDLKCCGKCRSVWYCNREHQKNDWQNHKRICKILQEKVMFSGDVIKSSNESKLTSSSSPPSSVDTLKETTGTTTSCMEEQTVVQPQKSSSKKSKRRKNRNKKSEKTSISVNTDSNCVDSGTAATTADNDNQETESVTKTFAELSTGGPDPLKNSNIVSTATTTANHHRHDDEDEVTNDPRPFQRIQFPVPKSTKDFGVLAEHLSKYLRQDGHCIVNDLLPINAARAIRGEVEKLQESSRFIDGPLSGGKTSSDDSKIYSTKKIRSDKITWLQGNEDEYPNICRLMQHMDSIAQMLKGCQEVQDQCHIFGRTKAMVACYPGNGTGYAYHVDNPNKDGRCLTFIYYLNEGWDVEKNGGLLRILPPDDSYVDVEPILNRLLVFWSDRRNPHEVQPAWASRYAITMWYFDKVEREAARAVQRKEELRKVNDDKNLKVKETAKVEAEIKEKSQNAVGKLSEEELEAIALLVESSPDPRHILTGMRVAPQVQDALLRQLEERKKKKMASSSLTSIS